MELLSDNYLEHHGVKGQQWGVQNGPPYPLKPSVKKRVYGHRKGFSLSTEEKLLGLLDRGVRQKQKEREAKEKEEELKKNPPTSMKLKLFGFGYPETYDLKVDFRIWENQNGPTDKQKETLAKIPSISKDEFDKAKKGIKDYYSEIFEENGWDDLARRIYGVSPSNYLTPTSIFIPTERSYAGFKEPKDDKRVFGIMCESKLDPEHGLAIVFEDEKFKEADTQDIIL